MEASESPAISHVKSPQAAVSSTVESTANNTEHDASSKVSGSGLSGWAKNLKIPQSFSGSQNESPNENSAKSNFSRFTSSFAQRLSPKASPKEENSEGTATTPPSGFIGSITKGIVDSSKNAVKAVQVKARHVVSQNKRRYQDDGFDLDMTYITENIIAMGFPAGDMSSGFFGYVEGFYRNHMEEVIKFFETHHKDKYKVYNLCSERLYDASLFEGKVATFPFDDHNCPPLQLIISFCHSAYSWLKEDIENVVVVHCKAGMARTGLMISSLLLYLKFFPTAEESIDYYNQKRCFDAKALVLPSQIRYVKYFERTLTYFNGENQPGRRCMLRGFRLHRCPYWIRPSITVSDHNGVLFSTKKHPRTKDLSPEDFWFSAPKKGIMVFALPGEPGLTEVTGDFKIHFHDRQGDFYCWLNTTMTENRKILSTNDLDGFDKRKLPSPGFQVEVVLADYDPTIITTPESDSAAAATTAATTTTTTTKSTEDSGTTAVAGPSPDTSEERTAIINPNKDSGTKEKDEDVFSDSEAEETGPSKNRQVTLAPEAKERTDSNAAGSDQNSSPALVVHETQRMSINEPPAKGGVAGTISGHDVADSAGEVSEFKAMAADASVFSFGDEEDYESE